MKKFEPKVSIIIPVYNGSDYVQEAIQSALNQTYSNLEVIVVNDGSCDGGATEKAVLEFGDKIKYYYKPNGGVATALNMGIEKMTGEYFSWLSHDDLYLEDKISKEVFALSLLENKDTIVACNVDIVSFDKTLIKRNEIPKVAMTSMRSYLAFDQTIGLNGCSLLISKKLFKKYGNFNANLKVTQDYDMWYRLAEQETFYVVSENLVLSRQHANQGSKTMITDVGYEVDRLHSRFIDNLTEKELLDYVDNKVENYEMYFEQYKSMHCYRSMVSTALIYFRLLLQQKRERIALNFFNEKLFENIDYTDINEKLLSIPKKAKKRILFYNNVWITGGIERVLTSVFSFLKDEYEIYFVAFNFSENEGYPIPPEIKLIQISNGLNEKLSYVLLGLCQLLDVDLFIGNQNLDVHFLPVYTLLKEKNIKSISCNHYHYFLPFQIDWLHDVANIRNHYYNDATIVTWATSLGTNLYNYINHNGYYLPNPNTFECVKKIPKKKKNHLVTVGRYNDAFKRLDLILLAFSKILRKVPSATLTIVGSYDFDMILPGTEGKKLGEYFNSLHIPPESISFVGSQSVVAPYYEEAELFLFTSETEGFGMVLNEAATFATPTICFDISGLDDIIENGVNGYLVPKYDIESLVSKVVSYLEDNKIKTSMMQQSLRMAERFNIARIEENWKALLEIVFKNEEYKVETDAKIGHIIQEYENTILSFPSFVQSRNLASKAPGRVERFSYYLKTYGMKATMIKIWHKILRKIRSY